MKILITEAVDLASKTTADILGNKLYEAQYRSSHFEPILSEYNKLNERYYDDTINKKIESLYKEYFEMNMITKSTFNKRIRGLKILEEIVDTGTFKWKYRFLDNNKIHNLYTKSIDQYLTTRSLCPRNMDFEKKTLDKFSSFLIENEVYSHQNISYEHVISFIKLSSLTSPSSLDKISTALSKYINFLFIKKIIPKDISHLIKVKRLKNSKVKEASDINDIYKIFSTIDRTTSTGKRDYAIIALACITGFRAGDIVNIKLSDIDWKNKEIIIIQGKNNNYLKMPLNNEVYNALTDYVVNGRPKTAIDILFLRAVKPYIGLHDGVSINNMLKRRSYDAGVIVGGKNTIHGIRRMIASEMIKSKQSVYTVAQFLGHQSIKPTKQYINLDTDGLRKCALSFCDIQQGDKP